MTKLSKAKYGLPFLLLILYLSAVAQPDKAPASDDEFNVFLLSLATVFMCVMIGAAIVGAFAAALFFISLLALISLGILSASVAVGLYKRSVTAGFKTLLIIVFGTGCAGCGLGLSLLVHSFYPTHLSFAMALVAGLIAGAFGGAVMGLSLFTVIQTALRNISRRLTSST